MDTHARLALMVSQRAEGWTQKQIAEYHGISVSRVSELLRRCETRRLIAELQAQKQKTPPPTM